MMEPVTRRPRLRDGRRWPRWGWWGWREDRLRGWGSTGLWRDAAAAERPQRSAGSDGLDRIEGL